MRFFNWFTYIWFMGLTIWDVMHGVLNLNFVLGWLYATCVIYFNKGE